MQCPVDAASGAPYLQHAAAQRRSSAEIQHVTPAPVSNLCSSAAISSAAVPVHIGLQRVASLNMEWSAVQESSSEASPPAPARTSGGTGGTGSVTPVAQGQKSPTGAASIIGAVRRDASERSSWTAASLLTPQDDLGSRAERILSQLADLTGKKPPAGRALPVDFKIMLQIVEHMAQQAKLLHGVDKQLGSLREDFFEQMDCIKEDISEQLDGISSMQSAQAPLP